jgi:CheY-like chemotaxis protein
VSRPHTVLIAAPHLLSALTARMKQEGGEWIAFTDTDALKALDVITRQRPDVVALERLFADTPRGIALIQRIKADPALAALVIRIVSLDAQATDAPVPSPSDETHKPTAGAAVAAVLPSAGPLDGRGTRRVPRFKVASSVEVLVDGNRSSLIDLSTSGAQVVSQIVLKPNQRVRLSLYDDHGTVRVGAMIAWASFEMPPDSGPRYRVGLEFVAADPRAIEAYLLRHKA